MSWDGDWDPVSRMSDRMSLSKKQCLRSRVAFVTHWSFVQSNQSYR